MKYKTSGFTLIEIIMVMTIIAIFFASSNINIGDGAKRFEFKHKAKHFYSTLLYAQEEALFKGKPIGLNIYQTEELNGDGNALSSYHIEWFTYKLVQAKANGIAALKQQWVPLDVKALSSKDINSDNILLEVEIDDEEISLLKDDDDLDDESKNKGVQPLIQLDTNGEIFADFKIKIIDKYDKRKGFVIIGTQEGTLELESLGDDDFDE
jgi:prepilin-type N-terminal cleavage/methylation domain-containing protein